MAAPAPQQDELTAARAQAADEARGLAQQPASDVELRDTLDDLATRLDALLRHLDSLGLDAGALREIVEMVRDDTIAAVDRWDRARRALTEFAEGATRRPFWKGR